jgi:hypothetical protein
MQSSIDRDTNVRVIIPAKEVALLEAFAEFLYRENQIEHAELADLLLFAAEDMFRVYSRVVIGQKMLEEQEMRRRNQQRPQDYVAGAVQMSSMNDDHEILNEELLRAGHGHQYAVLQCHRVSSRGLGSQVCC